MAAVSLAVVHVAGKGLAGLVAATVAALAAYVPIVYPMRHLIRGGLTPPDEEEELPVPEAPHQSLPAGPQERQPLDADRGPGAGGEAAQLR
jgi:hypothetical protein